LPLLPVQTLTPHLPLLVLQTTSALSHIFPEIRLDACRLVQLLLDQVPHHIVSEPGILEGLTSAVGLGGNNAQMGFRITPVSKLVTLRVMLAYVSAAIDTDKEGLFDQWMDCRTKPAALTMDAQAAFEGYLIASNWSEEAQKAEQHFDATVR
jgi:hypothetical protein